ncbi:hypothetical protein ACGFJC_47765 [Nonomuraea fuscirosea]|uniref:hypothetical protein n=1 Tax=Nonomuraea fuscirosea TaxID=1291556 RepID=UPI00371FCC3E
MMNLRHRAGGPPTRAAHSPERDLDPVASALAGVDIYRAACRCGELAGPQIRDRSDLHHAYSAHIRTVQAS